MGSGAAIFPELSEAIATFRHFNRNYTRFLGTLNEKLLDTEFSLAEARVLYELATRTAPIASEIADELGMDKAYLSRILRAFESAGLLRRSAAENDARRSELVLTRRGRAAFQKLNALSNEQGRVVLEALGPEARAELIRSMRSIENVLAPEHTKRSGYLLRPHRTGDLGWIVHRESTGYAEQYGWDETFETFLLKLIGEFAAAYDARRERCWIAEIDGQNMGHVFLMKDRQDDRVARLRLLFVERAARGKGLGEALVRECIRFARTAGYRKLALWTQSILTAAHRIYERAGFRMVKEEPHQSWGAQLIGQEWELDLSSGS